MYRKVSSEIKMTFTGDKLIVLTQIEVFVVNIVIISDIKLERTTLQGKHEKNFDRKIFNLKL